jgi:hypothetical protein
MAATDEIERYKRAMNDAFQQLDWCIGYLQGIHKQHIARALSQNRQHIATQIAGEKDEAELPTQEKAAAKE